VLPKEEKQVRGSEVVARHDWWGGWGATSCTSRRTTRQCGSRKLFVELPGGTQKQKGVKGVEEVFWGVRHSGQAN
jgi:hypothetical protein